MSSSVLVEPTRRRPSGRSAESVRRLTDAAVDELREHGYSGLTVRNVATRAGVAPATAYTYFASKNHLIAEVFWRRLRDAPPVPTRGTPLRRVSDVLRGVALLVADEPALAAACAAAMLGDDADVMAVRIRIGRRVHDRLAEALGDRPDPDVLTALEFAFSGALLQAGLGYLTFEQIADQLAAVARLVLAGAKRR